MAFTISKDQKEMDDLELRLALMEKLGNYGPIKVQDVKSEDSFVRITYTTTPGVTGAVSSWPRLGGWLKRTALKSALWPSRRNT